MSGGPGGGIPDPVVAPSLSVSFSSPTPSSSSPLQSSTSSQSSSSSRASTETQSSLSPTPSSSPLQSSQSSSSSSASTETESSLSPTTSLSSPLQSSALSQSLSSSRAGTETESSFTPTTQPAGPNASSKSSHTPVIAGSVIAGTLLILTVVLLLWRYKTKSRIHSSSTPRTNDNSQVSNLEIEPYKLKEQHISTLYSSHARPQSVVGGNEARNSVHSTITITSALTERQVQLRDETEALREQMKILQQAVVSSNVELQREIGRMGAHIRRLESVWNSDWARGLSDDPPPHYES